MSIETLTDKPEFEQLIAEHLRCFVPDIDTFPCIVDENVSMSGTKHRRCSAINCYTSK